MSFEEKEHEYTVNDIYENEGSIGYIQPNAIIMDPQNFNMELIAAAPATKNPNKQNGNLIQLMNDGGNMIIDTSVMSNTAIVRVQNDPEMYKQLVGMKLYFNVTCKVTEEFYDNLMEETALYPVYKNITEYSNSFTEVMLNQLYGIENKKEDTSSMVDDMLSDIFGKKVTIKSDEVFFETKVSEETDITEIPKIDFGLDAEDDDEFDPSLPHIGVGMVSGENFVKNIIDNIKPLNMTDEHDADYENKVEKIKPDEKHYTFDEIIKDLQEKTGLEVETPTVDVNADSSLKDLVDNSFNKDIVSETIQSIYDIMYICNAKDSIQKEVDLDASLTVISRLFFEEIPFSAKKLIKDICENFYNNRELRCLLTAFSDSLNNELRFVKNLTAQDMTCVEDLEKYARVKDLLAKDFNRHYHYYTMITKQIMCNNDEIMNDRYLMYFCLLFQLSHLINKTSLKNENDLAKKEQYFNEVLTSSEKSDVDSRSMVYEQEVMNYGVDYMTKFRELIQAALDCI